MVVRILVTLVLLYASISCFNSSMVQIETISFFRITLSDGVVCNELLGVFANNIYQEIIAKTGVSFNSFSWKPKKFFERSQREDFRVSSWFIMTMLRPWLHLHARLFIGPAVSLHETCNKAGAIKSDELLYIQNNLSSPIFSRLIAFPHFYEFCVPK